MAEMSKSIQETSSMDMRTTIVLQAARSVSFLSSEPLNKFHRAVQGLDQLLYPLRDAEYMTNRERIITEAQTKIKTFEGSSKGKAYTIIETQKALHSQFIEIHEQQMNLLKRTGFYPKPLIDTVITWNGEERDINDILTEEQRKFKSKHIVLDKTFYDGLNAENAVKKIEQNKKKVKLVPKIHPILRYVWNRVHRYKYNWVELIKGASGSGKSLTTVTLNWELDNNWMPADHCYFSPKDFLEGINNIDHVGQQFMWDEVGVGLNAKKWQSAINILLGDVFQTFRYKRAVVYLVTPHEMFIDKTARRLLSADSYCNRVGDKPTEYYPYFIQRHRVESDVIFKTHPQVMHYKINKIWINRLAPKDVIDQYEDLHKEWKTGLLKKSARELNYVIKHSDDYGMTTDETIGLAKQILKENVQDYLTDRNRINEDLIQIDHRDLTPKQTKQIKAYLEREIKKDLESGKDVTQA